VQQGIFSTEVAASLTADGVLRTTLSAVGNSGRALW